MFRRAIYMMIILSILSSGLLADDSYGKFSISLNPRGILALNGNYDDTDRLKDMVLSGAGLGLTIRYRIFEKLSIEAGYSYNWMFIKEEKQPSAYDEYKPAFILPVYTLNGILFLSSGSTAPYLTLGGGICSWRFSTRSFGGETWSAPENSEEDFTNTSLIFNAGLGVEVHLKLRVSLLLETKYYYVFAKNAEKFGTEDFTNQGFLGISLGLLFHFGKKQSLEEDEGL